MQRLFNPSPVRRPYLRHVHRLIHPPRRAHRLADPEVNSHDVYLPGLPAALSGLRVVQLSDIHYGMFLAPSAAERTVELANALRPDLIALTGDFVTQSRQFIEPVSELMGRLRARLGVYAVLGNHDFRAGAETLTAALRRHGIAVLRNRSEILSLGSMPVTIAGIDDSRQNPDLNKALPSALARRFTLLLAHNPVALESAAHAGVDFVLSGHTHGGQIKFAFAEPFYQRFLPAGFVTCGSTLMYVNRGLGKVIVPLRLGCPPEVACFTLRSSRGKPHWG